MPFTSPELPPVTVCSVCQGDARAVLSCKVCGGSGVMMSTPSGWIKWRAVVDQLAISQRHLRRQANQILHVALLFLILLCLASFIGMLVMSQSMAVLLTGSFWFSGAWYVTMFWLGGFLTCFLIFHSYVYGQTAKVLPNWGKSKQETKPSETPGDFKRAREASDYFLPSAWAVIEQSFTLAARLQQTELSPAHLFAGVLATPSGGIFITRLGMDFEKIKEGLSDALHRGSTGPSVSLSLASRRVLLAAWLDAYEHNRRYVSPIEILLQAFYADEDLQHVLDAAGYPPEHIVHVAQWIRLQELIREEHDRFVQLARLKPNTGMNRTMTARHTQLLDRFSEDLTLSARNGYIAPVIDRPKEMNELLRVIESGRRSVILVGETGVGRTALIEDLARRMVEEDVPKTLFDKRLVSIHVPQVLAAGDPALAIDRLLQILQEIGMSQNVIMVMHGIEALVGSGQGPMDLAEAFASELKKGYFIVIGTSTPQAWNQYLERRTLGQLMERVNVPEMDEEQAIETLMAKSGVIEYQNQVFFSYGALEKAVTLSKRYLPDQRLPASALTIAREAATAVHQKKGDHGFVLAEDVAEIIHEKTNIPVQAVTQDESKKLLDLEGQLHKRVIGQDEAVKAVAQAMRRARADVREGKRPIANFLFLGPTGVGKTELSKALAAEYFGNENAMIRLDMSEYQDRSAIARVIGEPGDQRGGLLTEAVRRNPFSIVLLDELEKAHPDILTLFLQVMDDGRLTDGVGRTIDFTNVVLIATSNAGTSFIQEQVMANEPLEKIKVALLERELKGTFRPEFLNRFDGVIVFKPLTKDDVTQIAWLMINGIAKRLAEKSIGFRAEDAAVEELAELGFDPLFGARPLRRVIQDRVENELADLTLRNQMNRRDTVVLEPGGHLRVEPAK